MKHFYLSILLISALFVGTSCQKDYSYEGGIIAPVTSAAVYTFVGSPNACTAATQSGIYNMGVATTNSNTINIQVNVTTAGTYALTTSVVNGVQFSGTGNLTVGIGQTITLVANGGIPAILGTFIYLITNGTSNCSFSVLYGTTTAPATFTINCANAQPTGIYQQGMPCTVANIITLPVTVTTGGSYNITISNNGVTFSAAGILSAAPATQAIILRAVINNVPSASGTFAYTINAFGSAACAVNIMYAVGFTSATDSIVGMVDSVYTTFNTTDTARLDNASIPGYAGIHIKGTNGTINESFAMNIARQGNSLAAGTYTINNYPASQNSTFYSSSTGNFSAASNLIIGTIQNYGFNIIVTEITGTKITGTFFGRLNSNGVGPVYKTVTDGKFSITIYP